MDNQRQLILNSFLVESEEGLAQMEQSVLELESRPGDIELIQTIFRVVHNMKGTAGILDLQSIFAFAHTIEDVLDAIRKGRLAVTSELTTLLLVSLDILREMVTAAGDGKDETGRRAKDVLSRISRYLSEGAKNNGEADTGAPALESEAAHPGAAANSTAGGHGVAESARTLRVHIQKLDRLLNLAGEITIARGRVAQMLENKEKVSLDEIREAHSFADGLHMELQETILKARMVPVGPLFRQYSRTVRDLAKSHGKLAQLNIEGEDVEVDTSVVEHLKDPLLHMIRNAVDHGIETPAIRRESGKPPMGTITVRAAHQAGSIIIEVSDDGAGLDKQRIVDLAKKKGLIAETDKLSDQEIYHLVFESGFSTASEVSDMSGRGVGMDVVRRNVQALRGTVQIMSEPGTGTTERIRLPLTLAIIEGFGVGVGDETYVIPVDQVLECVELPAEDNDTGRKDGVLQLRNEPLPFLHLSDHFDLPCSRAGRRNIVVVQHQNGRAGLAVDNLYGTTQTVIKPLPPLFKSIPGVSGSAILGNGRVALILDIPALLHDFRVQESQPA